MADQVLGSPLFVLGTQRSGTTLLTRILSAHPAVYIQNELDLPKVFAAPASKDSILSNIKRQIYIESGYQLDEFLANDHEMLWGLKDPQLTEYLSQLEQFLPESKFIVIIRDGRGVTNSYMENKWGLGTNAYYGALRWQREVEAQLDFVKQHPNNCLSIRYEDLLGEFEPCLRRICDFLGLAFSAEMLNYQQQDSYYQSQRENLNTFKAPDAKIADKWRHKLSRFEIDVVEAVAGDLLTQLGYKCEGRPLKLSPWQLSYFKWHQKILGELQIQYRWRVSALKNYFKQRQRSKNLQQQER